MYAIRSYYDIISEIKIPEFPENSLNITDFGAIADGETLNTEAIVKAIDSISKLGGGKVIIPSGNFLTGPIHLKSNVNLHLEEGVITSYSIHYTKLYDWNK